MYKQITYKKVMTYKTVVLLSIAAFLWGCDSSNLPPEHPTGTITGNVIDGVVSGAQVTVYTFGDPRRVRLGGAVTDETGAYSINIQSRSRPILIEVSGGRYQEHASDTEVTLTEGQHLRAVALYQSQQPLNVIITPLTHLATGLAEHHISNGITLNQAIDNANNEVNQFFNIDTQNTKPLDITDQNNVLTNLNDEALYGFYLAGLSNWTAWANTKNQVAPHSVYTSIGLAQIAYNDIRFDGLLNGTGSNKEGSAQMQLAVGVVPLDADAYRAAFSLHMLAIANGANNKTGLQVSDLRPSANEIASRTSALLGTSIPFDLKQSPTLILSQDLDGYYSGLLNLNVDIGGLLGAERIDVKINNVTVGTIQQPTNPLVIDTTPYPDGEHQINLTAVDILDNTAFINFSARFDNTAPVVNVTSAPASSQTATTISGTYSDNIAGVQSVVAMEQQATLSDDGTWRADIQIGQGKNTVPVSVYDLAGNRYDTETIIYLDDLPPSIDTTGKHSNARFSTNDGDFFELPLQNSNATALFLESNQLDLDGTPMTRQALNDNAIPFFAFSVADLMGPDTATPPADITVRLQYQRNGNVLTDYRELPAVDNEYLVPLVSEVLAANWQQSAPLDTHQINIEVSDSVGNLSQTSFDFRTDIYVPTAFVNNPNIDVRDLTNNDINNTNFEDRAALNNLQFASNTYTFTNTTGKAFYINPTDNSQHTVEQRVEQLVREHLIQLKTSTEWQVGLMVPTNQCPDFVEWKAKTSIYNWNGSAWQLERVPLPSLGEQEPHNNDTLPSPAPATAWIDVPHFDLEFTGSSHKTGPETLSYEFDYIENPAAFTPSAAYVFNWKRENNSANPPIVNCPPKRFFQQRQVTAYESLADYPKTTLSEIIVQDTPRFSSSNITVLNNNTETLITAIDGWYRIPAGDSITLTKQVTTPELTQHNDDISNVDSFPNYTPNLNDKRITWHVNQNIDIAFRHDAGETNILNMPERSTSAGTNSNTYEISR